MSEHSLHDSKSTPLWKSAIEEPQSTATPITEQHAASNGTPADVAPSTVSDLHRADDESITPPMPPPQTTPAENYHYTIQDLPLDLRPRERLAYAGAGSLNNAELLAIILRTGQRGENVLRMSERILLHFGGMKGVAQATFEELCNVHGVGEAKAAQIQSALEFGKRLLVAAPTELPRISTPIDIANMLMLEMGLLEREELRVVLLDSRNHVIKIATVYHGSLNTAVVRVGEIFREAIRANSAAVILVHNHPSGDPRPSPEDTHTTRLVVEAGALLDIDVLDHLIIGDRCFMSMKEKGLGFG